MQHPLEPAIQVKVQTRSDNPGPVQAVDAALGTLQKELELFDRSFREACKKAGRETGTGAAGMQSTGDGFDPMVLS